MDRDWLELFGEGLENETVNERKKTCEEIREVSQPATEVFKQDANTGDRDGDVHENSKGSGLNLWELTDEDDNEPTKETPNLRSLPIATDDDTEMVFDFDEVENVPPPYYRGILIGQAGTGKTTLLQTRIKENPGYGLLCATTGIAAVNLSTADCVVRTINSVLGFWDYNSLCQKYQRGLIVGKMLGISQSGVNRLIVDEMSMFGLKTFEIINQALEEVNRYRQVQDRGGLGLMLVGDFLQLPPVEDKYVFESDKFEPYERDQEKLTKVYRQVDSAFLSALQAARNGDGTTMVDALYSHPDVTFSNFLDDHFPGTTIVGTNAEVDRINFIRLQQLKQAGKRIFTVNSQRWGKEDPNWKNIPLGVELSIDAYIMILNNSTEGIYANGSCGWIRDLKGDKVVGVELHDPKTGVREVEISPILRKNYEKHDPYKHGEIPEEKATWTEFKSDGALKAIHGPGRIGYEVYCRSLTEKYRGENREQPYYDFGEEMEVVGEITYLPVRLAYATTVHKSQGLTLDQCQIDYVGSGRGKHFFGSPGMSYVALSRVRSPKGLRIVGSPGEVDKKTNVLKKVLKWA